MDDETHVVVPMSRHIGALGNPVAIEIEYFGLDGKSLQP